MTQRLTVTDSDGTQRQIVTAQFQSKHKFGGPCIVYAGEALSDNIDSPANSMAVQLQHYAQRQHLPFITFNAVGHGTGSTKSDLELSDWTPRRAQADLEAVLKVAAAERPVLLVTSGLGAAVTPLAVSQHNKESGLNPVVDTLMFNPVPADAMLDMAHQQGIAARDLQAHFNQHGLIKITSPTLANAFPLSREAYEQLPAYALGNPGREKFEPFQASIVHGGADPVSLPYRDLYLDNMRFAHKLIIADRGRSLGAPVVISATASAVNYIETHRRHHQLG